MEIRATSGPRSWWLVLLGPVLAALVLALQPGEQPSVARMAAIASWMACWWITEAVPVAVTSLLPLVLLPLAGLASITDVAVDYGRPTIFLYLGGFLLALALQTSGAHRRIALGIVHRVGSRPRQLVLGFMLASWLLSMWMSNTSTAMLMLPIALSVLQTAADRGTPAALLGRLSPSVLLGVAYSANLGGMATLVGTPPNLACARIFHQTFPDAPPIDFLGWMLIALPFSAAFFVTGWFVLVRVVFRLPTEELLGGRQAVTALRAELGPVRRDETVSMLAFALAALLWMTGTGMDVGGLHVPGWRELLGLEGRIDDAGIALTLAVALFLVPSSERRGQRLLEWSMTQQMPWGMLLLFGGGFALASGFTSSGLSLWAGSRFEGLAGVSPWLVMAAVCAVMTLLTELTSNIATTEMLLPILATAAVALGTDPRLLMIPATLTASCAFMLPVGTPPLAIVYGSGILPMRDMLRAGAWFNVLGVLLVLLTFWLLAGPVLGIEAGVVPEWVR